MDRLRPGINHRTERRHARAIIKQYMLYDVIAENIRLQEVIAQVVDKNAIFAETNAQLIEDCAQLQRENKLLVIDRTEAEDESSRLKNVTDRAINLLCVATREDKEIVAKRLGLELWELHPATKDPQPSIESVSKTSLKPKVLAFRAKMTN